MAAVHGAAAAAGAGQQLYRVNGVGTDGCIVQKWRAVAGGGSVQARQLCACRRLNARMRTCHLAPASHLTPFGHSLTPAAAPVSSAGVRMPVVHPTSGPSLAGAVP